MLIHNMFVKMINKGDLAQTAPDAPLFAKDIQSGPAVIKKLFSCSTQLSMKGGRALRGKFGPLWSQKLKVGFHQFHPIGLLEEWSKCKILAFILLFPLLW